ncbi:manganese-oxidizing multicopper oxidase MnxG [Pseudomonas sp. P8_241]|uniref:manganese-oxidizing multicopper oxidase MnxG n=1 Tax=Pseudomonas sp. P8_241 TaxID=3043445 RepID=UPI002A361888|nr:manganese-oxidizing multicopper oxidase MnxG [Pseudomonas sp. P8_241]WPN49209.1 manganese-oxidizing multicopper oxidase MnxG [Pseudomonas sp. P8_241]
MTGIFHNPSILQWLLLTASVLGIEVAEAAARCERNLVANVVALDQPLMFNRLGAQNVNGMMFALRRDVVDDHDVSLAQGGSAVPGKVSLRPDKRPRPLVLRVAAGDCLTINLQNLLAYQANPGSHDGFEQEGEEEEEEGAAAGNTDQFKVDEQVADRHVGFQVNGMQAVNSIDDISSFTGRNANSLIPPGSTRSYTLYAEREGAFAASSRGATFGGEGAAGNVANGLFGQVVVLPKGGRTYRNTVTEEEMRLASSGRTPAGQPIVDYQARYPQREPWIREGKAGTPIINMVDGNEIISSESDAIVMGSNADGSFPPSTYPLEAVGKRNPAIPNRLEPFRDFASQFQDETAATQAFPAYWADPVMAHVLEPTRDSFMINYGSGGMGAEVVANRLGVGPMHDCLSCAYEEFFLSSHTVGDVAMLVDVPANAGLEGITPGETPRADQIGVKATMALYPSEPSNVNHSYIGDFVKFRNTHNGHEQHIFHLHGHQWLFNPNDDNSDYVDAQGIGPGAGYTYEIANGGSGNRNRVAGDAIYHCHFYPHFAQGMWAMWRVHDVFEEGTRLEVSQQGEDGFHNEPYALRSGKPASGARALPDGEIVAGTPIPAVVPLPGKAMAPMPGKVAVVPKIGETLVAAHDDDDEEDDDDGEHHGGSGGAQAIGSLALVDRSEANRNADGSLKNPGYPFWIGGMESSVGQRPPTPPLDMLDAAKAQALKNSGKALWANLDPNQSGGWDGGLGRHTLDGVSAGGEAHTVTTSLDFSKEVTRAKPIYLPEEGTEVEQAAMAFHAKKEHASFALLPGNQIVARNFRTNGALPMAGAPYYEPCMDDRQKRLTAGAGTGEFASGERIDGMSFIGASTFTADRPRIYKAANIQFDAVYNKVGYHFPQARILALWEDAWPVITKQRPPEPLVMRMNTFDCVQYQQTNLVPATYEMDDYQVRTPTDVIGQHIHLPKWDLVSADGSSNGWNYEDGVLSPGAVQERIHAIRQFNQCQQTDPRDDTPACPKAKNHPFFGQYGRADWVGARTAMQRWFVDPVVNAKGVDRGLGTIFTHDHLGPSTHQQIGLYATVLAEPAGSTWFHAETGEPLYSGARQDGGPTSWQAVISTGDLDGDGKNDSFREFFLEYSDFQHAYEAGVYVGAGPNGVPNPQSFPATADSFRYAINPPVRNNASNLLEGVLEVQGGMVPGCPTRPCPQAISVDDPGMFVVNYRNEPLALRVYDPNKVGPDGKRGMQADGLGGDLAYAMQSRTDRAIAAMNLAPNLLTSATGPTGGTTLFPPHINKGGAEPGDPFTPMLRTYTGDNVRLRVHAGGHEEEHNVTLHGVKWLQSGSGFGNSSNSGWRASQMIGISEQMGFIAPVSMLSSSAATTGDYLYSMDASIEGYWSGIWGVMRNYTAQRNDLFALPNNAKPAGMRNTVAFEGSCPRIGANPNGIGTRPTPQRNYEVVAALANDILSNPLGLSIGDSAGLGQHVGGPLNPAGGTLVFNSRTVSIPQVTVTDPEDGETITIGGQSGPLHDPTAILYVRKADLDPSTGKLKPGVPVEPLVLRAAAGDCINITLENRLPTVMPDLTQTAVMQGMVKRDRNSGTGSTTFSNNLMRPSSHVGLHAQLLAYDITKSDGTNVGANPTQTVPPRVGSSGAYPTRTYQYYAGHLEREGKPITQLGRSVDNINATAVEFGGLNFTPADVIKQSQKGMAAAMSVLPIGATWVEDTRKVNATVTAPGQTTYRDFAMVWQKALNMRWANGRPVEGIAAEGFGVPTDPQDNSSMAINYKTEPMWYRFGLAPDAPFGHADGAGYADMANAHMAYSNALVGGDPQTPVLYAKPGQPFRTHILMPTGGSRGTTFQLDGHVWSTNPFLSEKSDTGGYPMYTPGVGSVKFGYNPMSMYIGAHESVLPAAHFSFMMPSAGGVNAIPGDYLFRDYGAYGNTSGLWGLLRVTNEPEPAPAP